METRCLNKLSKNLYNYTLYTIRQYFFANGKYLNRESAYHMVKIMITINFYHPKQASSEAAESLAQR